MKRILFSLVMILAAVVLVAGTTRAVFSETSSFNGNTVSTATVDIDARSEPMGLLPKPLNVSGLVPNQWTNYARGVVYNTSNSTNVKVYMYLDAVTGFACDKVNLQVWTGYAASGAASERGWLFMNGLLSSYTGSANRREVTGYVFVAPNYLPKNTSAVIQQRAQLDPSADNTYQNKSCTWNEVFVAESIF